MKKSSIFFAVAVAAFGLSVSSLNAVIVNGSSVTVDFEDFYAGTLVGYSNTYSNTGLQRYTSANNADLASGMGFTVKIDSNYGPDVGALYDTDQRIYTSTNGGNTRTYSSVNGVVSGSEGDALTGEDPDLEYDATSGWNGGNLECERLGNALVIQEHAKSSNISDGHLYYAQGKSNSKKNRYAPDDSSRGGYIKFSFETDINRFGFDFIDLDNTNGNGESASITFYDFNTGENVEVGFSEFSTGSFSDRDANVSGDVVWGDGTANRIDGISVAELNEVMGTNLTSFSAVKFRMAGSGGIGGISYHYSPVPESSTVVAGGLIFLFLGMLHFARMRRKTNVGRN